MNTLISPELPTFLGYAKEANKKGYGLRVSDAECCITEIHCRLPTIKKRAGMMKGVFSLASLTIFSRNIGKDKIGDFAAYQNLDPIRRYTQAVVLCNGLEHEEIEDMRSFLKLREGMVPVSCTGNFFVPFNHDSEGKKIRAFFVPQSLVATAKESDFPYDPIDNIEMDRAINHAARTVINEPNRLSFSKVYNYHKREQKITDTPDIVVFLHCAPLALLYSLPSVKEHEDWICGAEEDCKFSPAKIKIPVGIDQQAYVCIEVRSTVIADGGKKNTFSTPEGPGNHVYFAMQGRQESEAGSCFLCRKKRIPEEQDYPIANFHEELRKTAVTFQQVESNVTVTVQKSTCDVDVQEQSTQRRGRSASRLPPGTFYFECGISTKSTDAAGAVLLTTILRSAVEIATAYETPNIGL